MGATSRNPRSSRLSTSESKPSFHFSICLFFFDHACIQICTSGLESIASSLTTRLEFTSLHLLTRARICSGRNSLRYELIHPCNNERRFSVKADLHLWQPQDKIVVVDIDGTVTVHISLSLSLSLSLSISLSLSLSISLHTYIHTYIHTHAHMPCIHTDIVHVDANTSYCS
jgi:hypothetical protein